MHQIQRHSIRILPRVHMYNSRRLRLPRAIWQNLALMGGLNGQIDADLKAGLSGLRLTTRTGAITTHRTTRTNHMHMSLPLEERAHTPNQERHWPADSVASASMTINRAIETIKSPEEATQDGNQGLASLQKDTRAKALGLVTRARKNGLVAP